MEGHPSLGGSRHLFFQGAREQGLHLGSAYKVTQYAWTVIRLPRHVRRRRKAAQRAKWLNPENRKPEKIEDLVGGHFRLFSSNEHHTKPGILTALHALKGEPGHILETGSSAWGMDSTRLWAKYVQVFGGHLWSVDLREEPRKILGNLGPRTEMFVCDSLAFLKNFESKIGQYKINLAYLDSFDVDWTNPHPAAVHGFAEWALLQPLLESGSVVVVDDTPRTAQDIPWLVGSKKASVEEFFSSNHLPPGKGSLIAEEVFSSAEWRVLHHSYNLVVQKL